MNPWNLIGWIIILVTSPLWVGFVVAGIGVGWLLGAWVLVLVLEWGEVLLMVGGGLALVLGLFLIVTRPRQDQSTSY